MPFQSTFGRLDPRFGIPFGASQGSKSICERLIDRKYPDPIIQSKQQVNPEYNGRLTLKYLGSHSLLRLFSKAHASYSGIVKKGISSLVRLCLHCQWK